MTFGMEMLEWCGYRTVKKTVKICLFVSTESMNVRDRQTPHDGTGHAYAQYRTAETLQEMLTS